MLVQTGLLFWILVALAVACVVLFLERFFELRRARIDSEDFIKGIINVLENGTAEEALSICADTPVPVANVAAAAVRHRTGTALALREAVDAQGRAEIGRLDRRMAVIAVIGQVAPMIGLLGTLAGFVHTTLLANGAEIVPRAELVDSAVSSLTLAALGIAISVPAAVMSATLRMRLDRLVGDLEVSATEIVGYLVARKGGRT